MERLLEEYRKKKAEIKKRLDFFSRIYKKSDRRIFSELCFCILTPQTRAVVCDEAIRKLEKNGYLFTGTKGNIRPYLKGVRFPNNKARYIVEARRLFRSNGKMSLKKNLDIRDVFRTRDWLVKNVKGMGYKEASHFLRNIGLGEEIAILDRHILRNLKRYGVIRDIPVSLTRRKYIDIESRMRQFFKEIGIPIAEIDLLFWSNETGRIFK